jgi:phosphoribosylamine--glycine ligase
MSRLAAPTTLLVLGSGGREHALAWKLAAEPGMNEVVVAPGADAMSAEPRVRCLPAVDPLDPEAVVTAANASGAQLVVIGPEAPLAAGVADALVAAGIPCFGPLEAAARIETSKAFCHDVAEAAGVRMARARAFRAGELEAAAEFTGDVATTAGVVLKADGLAAGKGVTVCDDLGQALGLLPSFLLGDPGGGPVLVVEERLVGREATVITICDGERAIALPAARDHKRLLEGDRGPNTGGMGAYSPVPDLPDELVDQVLETVHRPILAELARRGTPFRGFLYAGLMLTSDGPALLECNARLGDPEAQVILPRVAGALGPWLLAAASGRLPREAPARLPVLPGAAVGVVLAAQDYPGTPRRGDAIEGLEVAGRDALVFHAGTVGLPGGGYGTNGGRVLAVVGRGSDLGEARARAERAADAIAWPGMQRRRDIAAALPPVTSPFGDAAAASLSGSAP